MELPLFDQVDDLVRALTPAELGELRSRTHRRGMKAWFGDDKPNRSHYEAQVLARRHVDGVDGMALEIGFHAEHGDVATNVAILVGLESRQNTWREILGDPAEAGIFYDAPDWRRVSEAWIEPDLDDPDLAFEVASRLVDYLMAIQPLLVDSPD
jgi:hypothetical protein